MNPPRDAAKNMNKQSAYNPAYLIRFFIFSNANRVVRLGDGVDSQASGILLRMDKDRGRAASPSSEKEKFFKEILATAAFCAGRFFRLLFFSSSVGLKKVDARRRDVGPNDGGAQMDESLEVDKVFGAQIVGELNEAAGVAERLFNLLGDFLAQIFGQGTKGKAGNDEVDLAVVFFGGVSDQVLELGGVALDHFEGGKSPLQMGCQFFRHLNGDQFLRRNAARQKLAGDGSGSGAEFDDESLMVFGNEGGHSPSETRRAGTYSAGGAGICEKFAAKEGNGF